MRFHKGGFRGGRTGRTPPLIFFQIRFFFITVLYDGLKIYNIIIKNVLETYRIWNIYTVIVVHFNNPPPPPPPPLSIFFKSWIRPCFTWGFHFWVSPRWHSPPVFGRMRMSPGGSHCQYQRSSRLIFQRGGSSEKTDGGVQLQFSGSDTLGSEKLGRKTHPWVRTISWSLAHSYVILS